MNISDRDTRSSSVIQDPCKINCIQLFFGNVGSIRLVITSNSRNLTCPSLSFPASVFVSLSGFFWEDCERATKTLAR